MPLSSDVRRVVKNFAYLFVTKGIDFIIPLVLLPFLINTLGIAAYGTLAFALAIGVYFTSFMQYGFNITAVRDIARQRQDQQGLSSTFSHYFYASLVICTVACLGFLSLFFLDFFSQHQALYVGVLLFCLSQALLPLWLFQGLERMEFVALLNTGIKVAYVILIIALVRDAEDVYLVPMIQGAAGLLGVCLSIILALKLRLVRFTLPQIQPVFAVVQQGWSAFVIQVAPTLYSNSSTFILGLYSNPATVGIYAAALRIIDILNAVGFLLTNAVLPYLARDLSKHVLVAKLMLSAGVTLTLGGVFIAPFVLPWLFDQSSSDITPMVQILSLMVFFIFTRFCFGNAYLMLIGGDTLYQRIVLSCSLVAFALSWWVIPRFETWGAAGIMVGTSVVMAVLTLVAAIKKGPSLVNTEVRE